MTKKSAETVVFCNFEKHVVQLFQSQFVKNFCCLKKKSTSRSIDGISLSFGRSNGEEVCFEKQQKLKTTEMKL